MGEGGWRRVRGIEKKGGDRERVDRALIFIFKNKARADVERFYEQLKNDLKQIAYVRTDRNNISGGVQRGEVNTNLEK